MCSNRCANPVRPGRSLAEPTWYQRFTATMGAAVSGDRVTNKPFGSRTVSTGIFIVLNCTAHEIAGTRTFQSMTAVAVVVALVVAGYAALLFMLWRHQERIVFQPPAPVPGEACDAEQLRYTASDGTALFSWVVEPRSRRGVLLYFHGNAVLARWMVPWARHVAESLQVAV